MNLCLYKNQVIYDDHKFRTNLFIRTSIAFQKHLAIPCVCLSIKKKIRNMYFNLRFQTRNIVNLCYHILSRLNAVRQLIVPFHFLFIYINNFTLFRELYVGDQGSHSVQICGLDGRDCRELNVTDGSATFWPNQITIDHVSE